MYQISSSPYCQRCFPMHSSSWQDSSVWPVPLPKRCRVRAQVILKSKAPQPQCRAVNSWAWPWSTPFLHPQYLVVAVVHGRLSWRVERPSGSTPSCWSGSDLPARGLCDPSNRSGFQTRQAQQQPHGYPEGQGMSRGRCHPPWSSPQTGGTQWELFWGSAFRHSSGIATLVQTRCMYGTTSQGLNVYYVMLCGNIGRLKYS